MDSANKKTENRGGIGMANCCSETTVKREAIANTQTRGNRLAILRLLIPVLFLCGFSPLLRADNYDTVRTQWVTMQVGTLQTNNPNDPDIVAAVTYTYNNANNAWKSMNTTPGSSYLWSDLTNFSKSATIDSMYSRIEAMAIGYAQPNNPLYGNSSLLQAITYGLDWLNTNYYNPNVVPFDNWWDWEIGDAQELMTTALLIYNQLTPTEIANYTAAIDFFDPNPGYMYTAPGSPEVATGANLTDISLAVVLRGILGKDSAKITAAENALGPVYQYVTTSDGFYVDGSFIQHAYVPYTGGYGSGLFADLSNLFLLLNNSAWPITDPNAGNVYNWASQSFVPLLVHGAMFDMVGGRSISRCSNWDHWNGRGVIASLARLSQGASPTEAAYLQGVVKEQVNEDTSWPGYMYACNAPGTGTAFTSYYAEAPAYDVENIKGIMNNASITAATPLVGNFNFASMERVVHRRTGFTFGLSLNSPKISDLECGLGENLKPWYQGLGATYLYTADLQQYDNSYWATVNPTRLAGVTTDNSTKTLPCNLEPYLSPYSWVGGSVVDGLYGSTGMQFTLNPVTGSSLTGLKSWFWFGNKMVALGAGINSTSSGAVETIVDNRMIDAAGDNALVINGTTEPTTLGWSASLSNVTWAYAAGNVANSGIGYYFPFATGINALRESRTGAWSNINSGGPTATHTQNYLNLAIEHGTAPTSAGYAYVVLPNQTATSMAAYAANPDVTILENSTNAQAVYDANANAYGINIWSASNYTVYNNGNAVLTASNPSSVTAVINGTELDLGVSDPTQLNTGTINFTLGMGASSVISTDPQITVTQLKPTIKFSVNVNGSAGKSYQAKFTM
jgi:hyaluronate lyase